MYLDIITVHVLFELVCNISFIFMFQILAHHFDSANVQLSMFSARR